MTCRQLAMAGRYLAFSGRLPGKDVSVISSERAQRISVLMLTCGDYDASGDFAFRVACRQRAGSAAASSPSAPGKASIAVWSPGLDRNGNAVLGSIALKQLAKAMRWSVFGTDAG